MNGLRMPKINWEKWASIVAVAAALIAAGMTIEPVMSYASRISALESDDASVRERLIHIEDKLDFMMSHLGIHYTKNPQEEHL